MKRLVLLGICCLALGGCSLLQKINWNEQALASAAGKAVTAASITDEQIIALCKASIAQMDAEASIDRGSYATRLNKLMKGVDKAGELDVNFAVYKTNEINAFACGDGSIRVYSGLMDVMNDEELVAIIGHELGHLVHQDTKNAMKKAYLAAAAVDVVAAAGNVGAIAASTLGDISQAFINAQFSQKQEYAADQYGFEFAISRGQSAYSMCNALNKLVELSGSSASSSAVAKMFSFHPNSAERAEKMKAAADKYQKK